MLATIKSRCPRTFIAGRNVVLATTKTQQQQRRSSLSGSSAVAAAVPRRRQSQEEDEEENSTPRRPRLLELRRKLQENVPSVTQVRQELRKKTKITKQHSSSNISNNNNNNSTRDDDDSTMQLVYKLRDYYQNNNNDNNNTTNKLLLTDSFNRQHSYLRLSLVEKCNLRCLYCMPEQGIPNPTERSELLTTPELLQLASLFVQHGVNKIKLTGGEPLLRNDICEVVQGLSATIHHASKKKLQQIGMTTNGILLTPSKLDDLLHAGLTHVNISLDTLRDDRFRQLTRRKGLQRVLDAIDNACHKLPPHRIKLNVVVMNDINTDELTEFVKLTTQLPPINVRFIEWMPFHDNGWNNDVFVSYSQMLDIIQRDGTIQLERLSDGPNDTTKWYQVVKQSNNTISNHNNNYGRVGFITSMSQHFCGTCNRLRLTADGNMKVCLFGREEVSLRNVLRRTDEDCDLQDVENVVRYALSRKHYKLGGHDNAQTIARHSDANRPMTTIGG